MPPLKGFGERDLSAAKARSIDMDQRSSALPLDIQMDCFARNSPLRRKPGAATDPLLFEIAIDGRTWRGGIAARHPHTDCASERGTSRCGRAFLRIFARIESRVTVGVTVDVTVARRGKIKKTAVKSMT
jgi:hypothetical protein